MAKSTILLLVLSIIYIASPANSATTSSPSPSSSAKNFIKASCSATTYPTLCVQSLSQYATSIQRSRPQLIQTAFSVSLDQAQSTKRFAYKLTKFKGLKPRMMAVVKDCFTQIDDTVDRLRDSIRELKKIGQNNGRRQGLKFHISNVQTWTSAALTNVNSCIDGFAGKAMDGRLKISVGARMVGVARITSNALALVNKFGPNL